MAKRAFDVAVSLLALLALFPVMLAIGVAVLLTDGRPALFRQARIGRHGRPFTMLKFRTMRTFAGPAEAASDPARITRLGGWLRRRKLDELPQLLNVFFGDMSLVGPRPELSRYVRLYNAEERRVLEVRPGVTDPATLEWAHDNDFLTDSADPERIYIEEILPAKLARSIDYLAHASLSQDVQILARTLGVVMQRLLETARGQRKAVNDGLFDAKGCNGAPALAVIGASFFNYTEAVVQELRGRGINVVALDEKRSNGNLAKIIYRLGLGHFPLWGLARYHRRLADSIISARIPDVLLLGVEVIGREFVSHLATAGVRVHLHMWDAKTNQGRFAEYRDLLTSCATFDPCDARQLGLTYIPLFAEPLFGQARKMAGSEQYDIAFCGTMHSSRGIVVSRLLARAAVERISTALLLYYHSRWLFAIKALFQWRLFRLLPVISSSPYPKRRVARLFANSRVVLDLPHPGQSGLTMRTFEGLLAGARLVTTNPHAKRLLLPSLAPRVYIVGRPEDDVVSLLTAPHAVLPALSDDEVHFLSLARFVDQILGLLGLQTSRRGSATQGSPELRDERCRCFNQSKSAFHP